MLGEKADIRARMGHLVKRDAKSGGKKKEKKKEMKNVSLVKKTLSVRHAAAVGNKRQG